MAVKKGSPKAPKKGSKLASMKTAILGAAKRKAVEVKKQQITANASKKAGKPSEKPSMKNKKPQHVSPAKSASHAGKHGPTHPAPSAKTPALAKAASAKAPQAPAPVKLHRTPKNTYKKSAAPAVKTKRIASSAFRMGFDAHDESVCREVACEGLATSAGYCRLHYIKNWKKIKRKEVILKEGKLIQYIEELVVKYPDKYIEAIRHDLANDKEFAKVIHDLDLDESADDFDPEGESLDAVIGDIKRDFDDDSDTGF
jgi:hypothetical protein